ALRRDHIFLHQAHEIGSAREHLRIVSQHCDGGFDRCRRCVFNCLHYAVPPFSMAARTLSGVSGSVGTRTPMALATALEMAAPGEITGGSPSPITPRSSKPGPVIM